MPNGYYSPALLPENIQGEQKTIYHCFLKQYAIVPIVFFYCFSKILGGQMSFEEAKWLGRRGRPCLLPSVAESQYTRISQMTYQPKSEGKRADSKLHPLYIVNFKSNVYLFLQGLSYSLYLIKKSISCRHPFSIDNYAKDGRPGEV